MSYENILNFVPNVKPKIEKRNVSPLCLFENSKNDIVKENSDKSNFNIISLRTDNNNFFLTRKKKQTKKTIYYMLLRKKCFK